ncbi:MAG: hypothetical protein QG588_659 [Candidatus Poribacteria bacterium]|nr:hypothetical protein [Candidatus Poribacteria bacterium]
MIDERNHFILMIIGKLVLYGGMKLMRYIFKSSISGFWCLFFILLFSQILGAESIVNPKSDDEIVIDMKIKSAGILEKQQIPTQILTEPITDESFNVNMKFPRNMRILKGTKAYRIFVKDSSGKFIKNSLLKDKFILGVKYPDSIKPDIARNLRICMLSNNVWIPLPSQLDTSNRIIKTEDAKQLGIYRLLAPSSIDLKGIFIYPNPVQFGTYGGVSKTLKFQNVPLGSVIEIFTVTGEKIKEIKETSAIQVLWDGTKDNGDIVTNGLYIYRIQTAGGEAFGKIAVLR